MKKISLLLAVLCCAFLTTGARAFTLETMCPQGYHLDKSAAPEKICCVKDSGPKGCGERTGGCFLNSAKECVYTTAAGTTTGCTDPELKKKCCTAQVSCEPMPNCAPDAAGRCMKKNVQPPMACPNVTTQMVNGALVCCKPGNRD